MARSNDQITSITDKNIALAYLHYSEHIKYSDTLRMNTKIISQMVQKKMLQDTYVLVVHNESIL